MKFPVKSPILGISGAAFLALTALVGLTGFPTTEAKLADNLQKALPLIKQQKIAVFRNSDWCQLLSDQSGQYSNNSVPNCQFLLNEKQPIKAFDQKIQPAFEQIRQQLTRPKVEMLEVTFTPQGEIASATFDISTEDVHPVCRLIWSCDRKSFIYQPKYGKLPDNMGSEEVYQAVNQDWYIKWEDWN
jgi:hypothetical protein